MGGSQTEEWIDLVDSWTGGWIDRHTDGWADGSVDGHMAHAKHAVEETNGNGGAISPA